MFSRVGAAAYKPGLDTSIRLDNYFGNPHKKYKCIHVGGTNGKGSTSHMLAAMLQAQGYKVGLYTSPHLVDFRERIRINGKMIGREEVIEFVDKWKKCGYDGRPSFFELTMMMAFDAFARHEVDYAVIEVGMGGRLDSTNIISPIATVITNISFDHMQFLGDSLEKIASEKAGIIKSGVPVVIGEASDEIRKVFLSKAMCVDTFLRFADTEGPLSCCKPSLFGGWECSGRFVDPAAPYSPAKFHAELAGEYQKKNINTVLCAVDMLRRQGVRIDKEAVIAGFGRVCELTGFAGRWMTLSSSPLTICDTGHNEAGLTMNMKQLQSILSQKEPTSRLHMVMGFVNDKDVDHILRLLPGERVEYYITQASVPRAMHAEELAERFREAGLGHLIKGVHPDVKTAFKEAQESASEADILYVGGSTFVVADLLS
ncbi:MAG: bifunctional folylpolyglutamate synthase/dihydrofolate synthase [Muribaculum sp.]|nr:bifunctional folylpolyglutamate synthase/dihydrofolate synthase [Muribaculum sp.]